MKSLLYISLFIFLYFIPTRLMAQSKEEINLIANPSFEGHNSINCGVPSYSFTFAEDMYGWYVFDDMSTGPLYLNKLDTLINFNFPPSINPSPYGDNTDFNVPYNSYGYQYAHTGNSYIGLVFGRADSTPVNFSLSNPPLSTYISDSLLQPLTIGHVYEFSMYVNAADQRGWQDKVNCENFDVTNGLGFKLNTFRRNRSLGSSVTFLQNPKHAFIFDTLISDTTDWVLLKKRFVADSAYTYLQLGYYFNTTEYKSSLIKNSIYHITPNLHYSVHFIDDVSLVDLGDQSNLTDTKTETTYVNTHEDSYVLGAVKHYTLPNKLVEPIDANEMSLFVNNANHEAEVHFTGNFAYGTSMQLYAIDGRQEMNQTFPANPNAVYSFSLNDLTNGIYICSLNNAAQHKSFKIVVNK